MGHGRADLYRLSSSPVFSHGRQTKPCALFLRANCVLRVGDFCLVVFGDGFVLGFFCLFSVIVTGTSNHALEPLDLDTVLLQNRVAVLQQLLVWHFETPLY